MPATTRKYAPEELVAGLKKKPRELYWHKVIATAREDPERFFPHIQKAIETGMKSWEFAAERNLAVSALGQIKHPIAIDFLGKVLSGHEEKSTRSTAAAALRMIGGEKARVQLEKALRKEKDKGVREAVQRELGLMG